MRKKLEEMNLIDDFLMNCVASDPVVGEACFRKILSVLLEREIGHVRVNAQRMIPGADTDKRGIRMDVELEELSSIGGEETVARIYDIEPHTRNDLDFPRHNRFYQAKIDGRHLKSGEKRFEKLPDLYVITITNFDIFGEGHIVYTFRNRCEEVTELDYRDGLRFVYFNTKGKMGGSQAIRNMLNYIQKSSSENVSDEATKEIDGYVEQIKADPALKEGAMTLGYYFDLEREEGRREATVNNILELLEDLGSVPEAIKDHLNGIEDAEELKRLHKAAAHCQSISEFEAELKMETIAV